MMSTLRRLPFSIVAILLASACGGSSSGAGSDSHTTASSSTGTSGGSSEGSGDGAAASDEFQLTEAHDLDQSHGEHPSEIHATATQAAMHLFVMDPDAGATPGVVIKLTGPDGHAYYTGETDSQGYAEVLVPAGARYDLDYLTLGQPTRTAHVEVPAGPNQDIRLTLRHRSHHRPRTELTMPSSEPAAPPPEPEHLVLDGILFDRGSATIEAESNPRLDRVVEFMEHMASVRIRISGHTDNVGDAARNQQLSEARAEAVRAYLVSHGIDGSRVEAVGYGDSRPVASNDTEEGRAQNRRIEAEEI